jgi:tetratricopeptide (TPR) repeat protein
VSPTVNPAEFVRAVKPVLERKDLPGLLALLKSRWTPQQIVSLMCSDCSDARKVAALSLALVGCDHCLPALAEQLKDPDPTVNQMAEHAIWCIWFRGGTEEANHELCRGAKATDRGDYEHAIQHFNRALGMVPNYPEAYNQRALAEFLMERFQESLADCRRAVELMPIHFGAWAGMGHCHAHLGNLSQAVECYERALSINPHMSQIREAVVELRSRMSDDDSADEVEHAPTKPRGVDL